MPEGERDVLSWLGERWVVIAGVAVLLLLWLSSGRRAPENGRYVLVRDDIPCQAAVEGDERRWCYLVLDTRTGKMEERVRKIGKRGRR